MGKFFQIGVLLFVVLRIALAIYKRAYYHTDSFKKIKQEISAHVEECNEFNSHIEDLKDGQFELEKTSYGEVSTLEKNTGYYNYKRAALASKKYRKNTYDCSLAVYRNATTQPFKYLCKYFNIDATDETLSKFEDMLNDFLAADQGREMLIEKKNAIMNSVSTKIPWLIRKHDKKRLEKKLDFADIDLDDDYYPVYTFRYISAGGNSGQACNIVLDPKTLEQLIEYLAEKVKFKKSAVGQRSLMTSSLREKIKQRDNFTCQCCHISTTDEPHLLLEIDHIVPICKGGLTTESNLQTLCWKCNRTKAGK